MAGRTTSEPLPFTRVRVVRATNAPEEPGAARTWMTAGGGAPLSEISTRADPPSAIAGKLSFASRAVGASGTIVHDPGGTTGFPAMSRASPIVTMYVLPGTSGADGMKVPVRVATSYE